MTLPAAVSVILLFRPTRQHPLVIWLGRRVQWEKRDWGEHRLQHVHNPCAREKALMCLGVSPLNSILVGRGFTSYPVKEPNGSQAKPS